MDKFVKAEDVKDLLNGLDSLPWEDEVEEMVDRLVVDDVEKIVRCIHCVHLKTNVDKENYCDIHSTTWDKFYVRLDDYCSMGERR